MHTPRNDIKLVYNAEHVYWSVRVNELTHVRRRVSDVKKAERTQVVR